MKNRAQLVRVIYTAINLYIATTVLLAILQATRFRATLMGQAALFMVLSVSVIMPLMTMVLWFLNRRCRSDHTRAQRRYLIASRIIFVLAWLVSCVLTAFLGAATISQIRNTKRSTTISQMSGGHQFIVNQAMIPGFLDPTIKRSLSIRWTSGRTEDLPTTFNDAERYAKNVVEAGGYVLIPAGRSLFHRPGTISSARGSWRLWEISSSQSLHAFLRKYAKANADAGVTITPYIEERRIEHGPSIIVVDSSIMVTNEDIRYDTVRYFASAVRNRGFYTPHLITSVDTETFMIVMTSIEAITSMPRYLVFSATNAPNLTWVFSESETKAQELQQGGSPYASPATVLESSDL